MKNTTLAAALLSFSAFTHAHSNIVTELLMGQSHNRLEIIDNDDLARDHNTSFNAYSYGLRLGWTLTDSVSIELSTHHSKEATFEHTISVHQSDPFSLPGRFPEGELKTYQFKSAVELQSLRLGVKGKMALLPSLSATGRLGIAQWKYNSATPAKITDISESNRDDGARGYDGYAALGLEYKVTDNWHVGIEYSLLLINESKAYKYSAGSTYKHNVHDLSAVVGWTF